MLSSASSNISTLAVVRSICDESDLVRGFSVRIPRFLEWMIIIYLLSFLNENIT
jgi:hypothetical protein